MKFTLYLAAASSLALAGAAQASTNLVVNGDFSQPDPSTYSNGGWTESTNIPGWTSNTSDTIETGLNSTYGFANYSATIDTNLELNDNTFGSISQTFTGLTPGNYYDLSWAFGNRAGSGYQYILVQWDGQTVLTECCGSTGVWFDTGPFRVDATSGVNTLTFTSEPTDGSPAEGNELTAVSLTYVPEPAAWALMLVGLGGIGAMTRLARRRHGAAVA